MADTSLQVSTPQPQLAKSETFAPRNLDEAIKFANLILESGMAPKSYAKGPAAAIVVALQFGLEIGFQPMQSLQNIASINGQPSLWGDAALALVLNSPLCEYVVEEDPETIKKNKKATCKAKRRNSPVEVVRTFSYDDAQTAGILTNAVWKTYPQRMCQMRARSFCLRDTFPDVLKGLVLTEEVQDYSGPTIEGTKSTPAQTTQQAQPAEELFGKERATTWYKVYKAHGWLPEESKTFLKEAFGIEAPKNSADIPKSGWEKAEAWAKTKAPIRVEADNLIANLGWTMDEAAKFVNEQKYNWPAIVDALKAELNKRDQQEQ